MDLLVGVHPMPLFWPLNSNLIVLPFGVLPSAGKLNIFNHYFWRNLVIESGVLLPIITFFVPALNQRIIKDNSLTKFLLLLLFCTCGFISINLSR